MTKELEFIILYWRVVILFVIIDFRKSLKYIPLFIEKILFFWYLTNALLKYQNKKDDNTNEKLISME